MEGFLRALERVEEESAVGTKRPSGPPLSARMTEAWRKGGGILVRQEEFDVDAVDGLCCMMMGAAMGWRCLMRRRGEMEVFTWGRWRGWGGGRGVRCDFLEKEGGVELSGVEVWGWSLDTGEKGVVESI